MNEAFIFNLGSRDSSKMPVKVESGGIYILIFNI